MFWCGSVIGCPWCVVAEAVCTYVHLGREVMIFVN